MDQFTVTLAEENSNQRLAEDAKSLFPVWI